MLQHSAAETFVLLSTLSMEKIVNKSDIPLAKPQSASYVLQIYLRLSMQECGGGLGFSTSYFQLRQKMVLSG
jgi:hypothetical protein